MRLWFYSARITLEILRRVRLSLGSARNGALRWGRVEYAAQPDFRPCRQKLASAVFVRSGKTEGRDTYGFGSRLGVVWFVMAFGITACVDNATEHRVRANAFFRGGDYASALNECTEGLKAKPNDVGTLILTGKSLFELDRLDEARKRFEQAVEGAHGKGKTYVGDAHLGLAILASRRKDWREARAEFEKLLALDPQDVGTHANLARVCLELGDIAIAEEHARFAVKMRQDDEANLFVLGKVLVAAGKFDEAAATFARIVETSPKAPSGPYGLSMVAAKRGDKRIALEKLNEALRLHVPNSTEIVNDPAFVSLRDDPEFRALLAQRQ